MLRKSLSPSGLLSLLCLLPLSWACGPQAPSGGITADIKLVDHSGGLKRQSLRAAALPRLISRLQIFAMNVDGSTVAETNLVENPGPDEEQLIYEGGEWELERVAAGQNYTLVGNAFLGSNPDSRIDRALAFTGRLDSIEVVAGVVQNVGVLTLESTGIRIPGVDDTPPSPPNPLSANVLASGQALRVTIGNPVEEDATGYLLAISTSTLTQTPTIAQGTQYTAGQTLAPGIGVIEVGTFSGPAIVNITQLVDNQSYTVLAYAFDTDLDNRALNYSSPATAFATPQDSLPPDVPGNLGIADLSPQTVEISFVAPGEDMGDINSGPAASYELRASLDLNDLTDPASFEALPVLAPPPPAQTGTVATFERSFAALGVTGQEVFYVGLRAIDAAANAGQIATAMYMPNIDVPPAITAVDPVIALSGAQLTISGANLGVQAGMLSLTSTTGTITQSLPLMVNLWGNDQVIALLPAEAKSGTLTVTRAGDMARASIFLPVATGLPDALLDYEFPFATAGAPGLTEDTAALYREFGGGPEEGAIERIRDISVEGVAYAPFNSNQASTAITGTYHAGYDLFWFVASNEALSMTSAFVRSSTIAPDPVRVPQSVAAGGADSVAAVLLDGGLGGQYPGLISFSRDGLIRTATVADVRTQPFNAFSTITSTSADIALDRVTVARNNQADLLMAHRAFNQTTMEGRLMLSLGNTSTTTFAPINAIEAPRMGTNVRVLSTPQTPGGLETFVIVYEAIESDGRVEIRVMRLQDYGSLVGIAPFTTIALDRRLDDAGLILREGEVWLTIASAVVDQNATLQYTEIPVSSLQLTDLPPGQFPGVTLDIAFDDMRASLGCKPLPMSSCAIVWSGDFANVVFVRR